MANEPSDKSTTLMHSVIRMLDSAVNDGASYETIIHVLSLLCLVSILNRTQPASTQAVQAAPAGGANALQKIIGDLAKGDGGLGPESLMTLLPLLNSPQIKSKLNPATIGTVLGLLNNMGDKNDKHESPKSEKVEKPEKVEKVEKAEKPVEKPPVTEKTEQRPDSNRIPPTAATVTSMEALSERREEDPPTTELHDRRGIGRYLNWKTNF